MLFLNQLGLDKGQIGFRCRRRLCRVDRTLCGLLPPTLATSAPLSLFYAARKIIAAFLIITPWIAANFGAPGALYYVAGVTTLFALVRAIEETAYYHGCRSLSPTPSAANIRRPAALPPQPAVL
ncbi:MAG: hypothetical protein R2911_38505 [Caldilineaceae bacterium]